MITPQLMAGKGTEYILGVHIERRFNIKLLHNNAYENNRRSYEQWCDHDPSRVKMTTSVIEEQIIPQFAERYADKSIPDHMTFNVDTAGVCGDTSDIYFENGKWPGISLKNNSTEVKSLRYKCADDYAKIFGSDISDSFRDEFDNTAQVLYPESRTKFSDWHIKTKYYDACIQSIKNEMHRILVSKNHDSFLSNFNRLILGADSNNIVVSIKKNTFTIEKRTPVKLLLSVDTGSMKNGNMNRIIYNFIDINDQPVSYQNRIKNGNTYTHSESLDTIIGLKSSFTKV